MLFIFTADTHFDSPFRGENASVRCGELIACFRDAVDYAKAIGARAVVLGGDLFDTPCPSAEAAAAVRSIITSNKGLQFIAVCGNHDPLRMCSFYEMQADNFYVFPDSITKYEFEDVTFYGVSEKDAELSDDRWAGFHAQGRFITLSHGDIRPASLAATGASLCLMGHIHKTAVHTLSNGVRAIYSGCLAGRGFDECGPKGFYVIDSEDMSYRFIESRAKIYREYELDIGSTCNIQELLELLQKVEPGENEIARVRLCGAVKKPYTIDCQRLCGLFPQFFEIKDESTVHIDIMKNVGGNTLEGEFIRILSAKLEKAEGEERQKLLDAVKEGVLALRREE